MQDLLTQIVQQNSLHAKWLNTLSFMENAGARKISACESAHSTDLIQLKHAAEEHRHAYYLKKQIQKLEGAEACLHYEAHELLAPIATRQYLHRLDMQCSRYLKKHFSLSKSDLKYAAYLFVTYAIEVRADALYPAYQEVLQAEQSKVMVRSIIVEEEGHLQEMTAQLDRFDPNWQSHAQRVLEIEETLFSNWLSVLSPEVFHYASGGNTMA